MGTGTSQLLPFLATPLLTRLFDASDFALYTSFFAIATILAVCVGGKYHMAIILPKSNKRAGQLFWLSVYITIAFSIGLLILSLSYGNFVDDLNGALFFIPLYILFFGIWNGFIYSSIRLKRFKINAWAKVIQSASYIASALILGVFNISQFGLIIAKITGVLGSILYLRKIIPVTGNWPTLRTLNKVAYDYRDYPKFGIWPSLLNTASSQALVLVLTQFYTTADLGQYGLTYMILSVPLTLIGNSFKDVFYQKIADLNNQAKPDMAMKLFKASTWALLSLALPLFLILMFFAEPIFSFLFGSEWTRAGYFASILSISLGIRLVVSPLSSVFNATNSLRLASIWQTTYFVTTFATLGLGSWWLEMDLIDLLYLHVVHEVVLYTGYYLLEYKMIAKLGHR
jgi:O-antigen/teichoic acid export membrane protein